MYISSLEQHGPIGPSREVWCRIIGREAGLSDVELAQIVIPEGPVPVLPGRVLEWFDAYMLARDVPEGTVGFVLGPDPRQGFDTIHALVAPGTDLEDYRARFARWLRTRPATGYVSIPGEAPVVGRVSYTWSFLELYVFRHATPREIAEQQERWPYLYRGRPGYGAPPA